VRGPRFEFDAEEGEEQNSEQLIVDGFETLTNDDVATIAGIDDVAGAAGGLSLRSVTIAGNFTPGEVQEGGEVPPGPGDGGAGGEGGQRVEGGGAAFDVGGYALLGLDPAQPGLGPLSALETTDGRLFEADEADADVAVVDADYAASEELAVGDTLTVRGTDLEIVGLAASSGTEAGADVYLPLTTAQRLSENEDTVTDVYVQATDSTRLDAIEAAITEQVDGAEVTTADDLADQVSGSLSTAADLADGVGRWLSWLVLASAFVVAGLLAASSVSRRVREFGTLKAIGWTRGRITRQVMSESLVTGLFGGALGLAVGLATAWTITRVRPDLTAELGLGGPAGDGRPQMVIRGPGGEQAADSAGQTLDIGLTAPVSVDIVTLAVTLAVAGGLIAGAFAAWRAARLRPADALRRVA
jgi:ABC-type antimicrobial peptide transport system permease subunit